MALATSVKFDTRQDAVKEDSFYQLLFFPEDSYKRIHTLQYPEDSFYEEASRSGVIDVELRVIKTKIYPVEQHKRPDSIIVTDMFISNPNVEAPYFRCSNTEGSITTKGWYFSEFSENEKKYIKIQSKFFGPFSISVERLKDGYPQGASMGTHKCKNWIVRFGIDG